MNRPIEICCPLCGEVVILIKEGFSLAKPIYDFTRLDAPITPVDLCPACHKRLGGVGFLGIIRNRLEGDTP